MRPARSPLASFFPLALLFFGGAILAAGAQVNPSNNPKPDPNRSAPVGSTDDECQDKLSISFDILTPNKVDLSAYLDRVLARVQRNWCARMPESVRRGEQGKVVLDISIQHDGSVAIPELPELPEEATSGKKALDRAVLAAVRASAPFLPLPDAFTGPYLKLHFVFGYNMPVVLPKPVPTSAGPDAPAPAFNMPTKPTPRSGAGGGSGTQGADEPYSGGGVQMLTPDQGVDFSGYLKRVIDKVKTNWYAVMPDSARMGDRGRVVIAFKIMRDGTVPSPDPIPRSSSTKEPLDRAAMSAIRSSSPFEPLPSAFRGPYIELRFIFFYNYRPDEMK